MKKKIAIICLTLVIVSLFYPTAVASNNEIQFTLPEKGGGMAHCDPEMSGKDVMFPVNMEVQKD